VENPFKDSRFDILYAEGSGRIIKSQNVCGVRIGRSDGVVYIKFKRKEFIISSWIVAMVGNNIYGNDPLRDVALNGAIIAKKNDRLMDLINFASKLDEVRDENVFEIKYSSNKKGRALLKQFLSVFFLKYLLIIPICSFTKKRLKKCTLKKKLMTYKF